MTIKLGKIKDVSSVLVSDEIYQNSGKGTRASSEKLQKAFKTEDVMIIAEKNTAKGRSQFNNRAAPQDDYGKTKADNNIYCKNIC